MIEELTRRLHEEGIKHVVITGKHSDEERAEAMRLFNEDAEVRVFVGNQAAAGTGVNLPGYIEGEKDTSCNADRTAFLACNWSFLQRDQAESRNHGANRNRVPVQVTDYIIPGTITEEIRERLRAKKQVATTTQDVRDVLRAIVEGDPQEGD